MILTQKYYKILTPKQNQKKKTNNPKICGFVRKYMKDLRGRLRGVND